LIGHFCLFIEEWTKFVVIAKLGLSRYALVGWSCRLNKRF
jgi:hypothetical protein